MTVTTGIPARPRVDHPGIASSVNTATRHHWVQAGRLHHGDKLRSPNGRAAATVIRGHAPRNRDGWMWDLSVPGGNDHDFYIDVAATAVLVHNCPNPWRLTRQGASAVKQGRPFNTTFYQSASDGTWWTTDAAGHAGSAFKVYEETSGGLSWLTNADEYGNYIEGMWKGAVGRFIPWSMLHG